MAEPIKLEVVTPDQLVLSEDVDIVVAPGVEGEFGVLIGHLPFLSTLKEGEIRYRINGQAQYMAVSGGFAEVLPNKVTILAEAAEPAHEIDVDRAQQARGRAETRIKESKREDVDQVRAEAALRRSVMRIKIAGKVQPD